MLHNVLSLWNSKTIFSQALGSISHGNQHLTISNFQDICYFVQIFANKSAFEEQLGQGLAKNMLLDLFANDTASLIRSVFVADYKVSL